jgi:poly(3-hydroxybutyrate) depolymerase
MKNFTLLFLLALSSITAFAAAKPEKHSITSLGTDRTYYTFVPEKLTAPAPLLLLLHGSGRDGMSQIDEWKTLAEKEGIILVAPDSANSREWSMNTDGPEFLHDIVEAVRAKHSVDGTRMYIFGHSAGAVFALYMGVMESRYFAAAGVHAGAMGEDFYPYLDLAQRKIPITIWVGTEDPYFKPTLVKATQTELNKHGFDAKVVEIKGHDHNYYAVSKDLNPKIWDFFRANKLDAEASWQVYQRK